MDLPPEVLCRAIGTGGGSILALAVVEEPFTWAGLGRRLACSVVCGMMLGEAIGDQLGWSAIVPSRQISSSCLAAALGWWIMHALIRAIQAGWLFGFKKAG